MMNAQVMLGVDWRYVADAQNMKTAYSVTGVARCVTDTLIP